MNHTLEERKDAVLAGVSLTKEEALDLLDAPLEALCEAADEIRRHFCGDTFDICTIINGKCGRCSEDCKYCAQSAHHHTSCEIYDFLPEEEILRACKLNEQEGVHRIS